MFQQLLSHNDDIRRLVERGYAVALDGNHYLVVRDIPYLDNTLKLNTGAIVMKFVDVGQGRIKQEDHQIFFAGSIPHGLDGKPIPNLGGGSTSFSLSEASKDVVIQRSFSNKPKTTGKFKDFFEKLESYVSIISGPATERYQANPFTFRVVPDSKTSTPFKFRDTLTSRAEIGDLASRFKDDVIAVIGVGGTGSYILDFLVKTPVREIRAFDLDQFYVHNTFRAPGKLEEAELGKSKAEVFQSRYENFRTGLTVMRKFIDATCSEDLKGVTFAFVCVDKGDSRSKIFDLLISLSIPFIDVGMGLDRKSGPLNGMLRATYYSAKDAQEIRAKGLAPLVDGAGDLYRTNIQIGELNALNACLAVIRFKQLRGFYFEELPYNHLIFGVGDLKVYNEGKNSED